MNVLNVLNTISSVSICCYPAVLSTGISVDSFIGPCWMGNFLFGLAGSASNNYTCYMINFNWFERV